MSERRAGGERNNGSLKVEEGDEEVEACVLMLNLHGGKGLYVLCSIEQTR